MATDIAVVKKLVWENPGLRVHYADSIVGTYKVTEKGPWWLADGPVQEAATVEAAQAAAQADFEQRILSALSQDYLDLKASHDAAVGALRAVRNCFEVEYHDDGHIACLGHDNDGLRSVVRLLDGALAALTTPAAPVEAAAADADDGWIAWEGGECPVAGETDVDLKFRNGDTYLDDPAAFWAWVPSGGPFDIVAYRPAAGGAL